MQYLFKNQVPIFQNVLGLLLDLLTRKKIRYYYKMRIDNILKRLRNLMLKKCSLLSLFILFQYAAATAPNTIIANVSGFISPYAIAITPNSLYAYVTDGSNVRVINTDPSSPSFNTIIAAPGLESILTNAPALAITPNGHFAYIADSSANSVVVIDINPSSPTFNTVVTAPSLVGTFEAPNAIAITPDGSRAYVANLANNNASVIDINPSSPTYNTILSTPGLNGILISPFDIAITPSGLYGYVANLNGTMTVIDTNPASPTYNTQIAAPGLVAVNAQPEGFAFTANGLFAYVSNGAANEVTFIDVNPASPTFNTVLSAPNLLNAFNAPNDVAVTPDGSYAYVTNFLGTSGSVSSVSVIDTNPLSPTYNTVLLTPGLDTPGISRLFTLAATPKARYVYAVDGFNAVVYAIYTGIIAAPQNFTACVGQNIFLSQTEYSNVLTWTASTFGNPPTAYKIYGDAGLTDLIATVPASGALQYVIHNVNPTDIKTYYIVASDGTNNSSPAVATTTAECR